MAKGKIFRMEYDRTPTLTWERGSGGHLAVAAPLSVKFLDHPARFLFVSWKSIYMCLTEATVAIKVK